MYITFTKGCECKTYKYIYSTKLITIVKTNLKLDTVKLFLSQIFSNWGYVDFTFDECKTIQFYNQKYLIKDKISILSVISINESLSNFDVEDNNVVNILQNISLFKSNQFFSKEELLSLFYQNLSIVSVDLIKYSLCAFNIVNYIINNIDNSTMEFLLSKIASIKFLDYADKSIEQLNAEISQQKKFINTKYKIMERYDYKI